MDEGTRLLTYDPGYAGSPVSASLPVDGHPKPANTWLDNLITDNPDQRAAFAAEHGCTDDPYDLLGHIGEDTAGAISLSRVEDPNWPTPILRPVTDDAIALSIAKLSSHDYTPTPHIDHRFSLGGQQPKLALARISGRWFAANWAAPSTHIFKPATSRHRYLNALEAATLQFASRSGLLLAAPAEVLTFKSQDSFVTQRWDREVHPDEPSIALPAEDLCQAVGILGKDDGKYQADLATLVRFVGELSGEVERDRLLAQIGFNSAIGNSDAHARNYSIVQTSTGWVTSPIYDTFPTALVSPRYGTGFALPVGGARNRHEITTAAIARFARDCGTDPERLAAIWREVDDYVLAHGTSWLEQVGLDRDAASRWDRWLRHVERTSRVTREVSGGSRLPDHSFASLTGQVYVSAHSRDGHPIRGHWRKRPSRG